MKFMKYMDIKRRAVIVCGISTLLCALTGCGSSVQADIMQETEYTAEGSMQDSAYDDSKAADSVEETVETEDIKETEETTQEEAITEEAQTTEEISARHERVKVKGIYVSGPVAGSAKIEELIELVDTTELNAMVIDIKNDDGRVTCCLDEATMAAQIGAPIAYIADIGELVERCKEKNIYLIARIVAFKDPYLAEKCPQLAVRRKNGEIFYDKSGLAWVNPYKKEVWDYLIEIGKQAAQAGFDEVQYDYIRFSTDLKPEKLDFGEEAEGKSKTDIITEFTKYAYEELSKAGIYVAADVYGTVIDSTIDQNIVGQNYVEMASVLDYICPMVYPSHYANGVYGIAVPDAQPYETVRAAMEAARKQLSVLPEESRAINRVWIQSFTASWVDGHISYGPEQIRAQMHGAYDAGFDEWILWNAAVKYQRASLLTEEEAAAEKAEWDVTAPKEE